MDNVLVDIIDQFSEMCFSWVFYYTERYYTIHLVGSEEK